MLELWSAVQIICIFVALIRSLMPDLLIWGGVFVLTLASLIYAANHFINASERIGLGLGIPPFIIGVTLVALGTSLPELITSILAVVADSSEIVLGNVVGSNISNICLIMGLTSVFAGKIELKFDVLAVDLPMVVGSAFMLGLMVMDTQFQAFEGLILLSGIFLYLSYVLFSGKENRKAHPETQEAIAVRPEIRWTVYLILLLSGGAIYFSAAYNVESIIRLSDILGISKEFISLTMVALGTSLPELVVSLAAIRSGNTEIAIGNVLGSNIFNIYGVMGIPSLFGTLIVPESILSFSLPMMIAASVMAFFIIQTKTISRWAGWILIMMYVLFVGNLISTII